MKIRLDVSDARYAELEKELLDRGIEIDDSAELILSERDLFVDHLIATDAREKEKVRVPADDIVCIESYGHSVEIYTENESFKTSSRLHHLIAVLDPDSFVRISNSVIISKKKVKKIKPSFSSKFILTMTNGRIVDVTRSYYNIFKEEFGI